MALGTRDWSLDAKVKGGINANSAKQLTLDNGQGTKHQAVSDLIRGLFVRDKLLVKDWALWEREVGDDLGEWH